MTNNVPITHARAHLWNQNNIGDKTLLILPTPKTPLSAHLWQAVVGGGVGNKHR